MVESDDAIPALVQVGPDRAQVLVVLEIPVHLERHQRVADLWGAIPISYNFNFLL